MPKESLQSPPSGAQTPLFQLKELSRDFSLEGKTVSVLSGLSLEIREGSWVALVGKSGSGKTTLLQLLGGLDHPTRGALLYRGEDMAKMGAARLTSLRRREFGFVFQSYHLLPELSAWENAAAPALGWREDRQAAYERARSLLEEFGLGHRLHHHPRELSGGEQQRVAIARALIRNPPVILADEPTGNLDPASAQGVMEIFRRLHEKQGKTIVMVTHDRSLAELAQEKFILKTP
ncbi:MAG: ABC transporter ATP-binding protein [Oligosphaeraceae bacterium]